jgi:hypothetical protein
VRVAGEEGKGALFIIIFARKMGLSMKEGGAVYRGGGLFKRMEHV